ncbi:bifunctional NAD(P)/FAD-dependent oxidoreductase/class I SAM-dependent methyltransferase [Leucobacter luti]|uniref:Thioredoxin reductase n=1 Tax=Leucobacter luti TaxID=340320 RepID=A0A4Q7U1H8_9MICO|nr:bifunctional NAD(P)/FAD-dependent oxidoreductase/class I SAM-dependent methyltransferase [Leucobacter luti]MBL3699098.1 NAD(P)/FAD-dependent oxidoreductase [Leucobacter luti]RZT66600.1 thioredoxin reductase [Leucobacter luti]
MTNTHYDAIIIGGATAGLSAAQALGRSLRRTLVIDAGAPRNRFATHMHNVLGLDGTPPLDLIARGRAEAAAYGVEFAQGHVVAVRDGEPGTVRVEWRTTETGAPAATGAPGATGAPAETGAPGAPPAEGARAADGAPTQQATARAVVVASGVRDTLPDVPGLADYWGSTVLHCPYCHGWEVRGGRLGVLATAPLSLHQATLIRQWSDRFTVFSAALGELDPAVERQLRARGTVIEPDPVVEVLGDGARVTGVRTRAGATHALDAIFTMAAVTPHDAFLAELELERTETPVGSFLAVDQTGRTSHPRIWAIGNVSNPMATVPIAMGAGAQAGGAVNFALVEDDVAVALATHPAAFWEDHYAGTEPVWSGRVNAALAAAVGAAAPGRSLDLGCGEGGDVLWLAERGWAASGIDLAPSAIDRARSEAAARGLDATFVAADLAAWAADPAAVDGGGEAGFDLVTASFLQSPVELPRERILRAAAARVAPGGRLVVIAHAAAPSWVAAGSHAHLDFPTPEAELAALALDPAAWQIAVAEVRERALTAPDGSPGTIGDSVVVAERLA